MRSNTCRLYFFATLLGPAPLTPTWPRFRVATACPSTYKDDVSSSTVNGSRVAVSSLTSATWSAIKGLQPLSSSVTRLSMESNVLFKSLLTLLSHCSADKTQVCIQKQQQQEISKTAWHREQTYLTHLQPRRQNPPPTYGPLSSALASSHVFS